jgi:hypothetical protein
MALVGKLSEKISGALVGGPNRGPLQPAQKDGRHA